MYLKGTFQEKSSVTQALLDLKASGFSAGDLDVFSDEPVEFRRGVLDRPSRMSLTAVTGAITLCVLTIGFIYFTQYNYPLTTGGMPIFSFWATGVIFFELTMLGGILTTLGCFIWESGLLRQRRRAPVPNIEPGMICLRVHCHADQMEQVSRCLARAGAGEIGALGESV